MEEKRIKAMFIFEIMGRPKEYVSESLEEYLTNLNKIDGLKILNKKIHEPKEIDVEKLAKEGKIKAEDVKDLYSSFAEVELEVKDVSMLFSLMFRLLPSHVEVIEPDELRLKNFDISSILSELAIKLHRYDEIAKILTMEKDCLERELCAFRVKNTKIEEIIKPVDNKKIELSKKDEKSKKDKKK